MPTLINRSPPPHKILCLDGGGTWAIIQIMALQRLYGDDATGHEILKNFDLVAANSGGSIVAAGLFLNLKLSDLFDLLNIQTNRKLIFQKNKREGLLDLVKQIAPRWEAALKRPGLTDVVAKTPGISSQTLDWFHNEPMHKAWPFGATRLPHLLLLAYDYVEHRARYFRTNDHTKAGTGSNPNLVRTPTLRDAVHASTNAPVVYFDRPASFDLRKSRTDTSGYDVLAWDGAMAGYNNPMVAAVTEALANGATRNKIKIMSIGTGADLRPIKQHLPAGVVIKPNARCLVIDAPDVPKRPLPRFKQDVLFASKAILSHPPDIATYTSHMMISTQVPGRSGTTRTNMDLRIARFNPILHPNRSGPDAAPVLSKPADLHKDDLERLGKMDMDVIAQQDVNLIKAHTESWLANNTRNQAIVATGPGGTDVHIGDKWFRDARRRAKGMGLCP